jgi:hypothetical protein
VIRWNVLGVLLLSSNHDYEIVPQKDDQIFKERSIEQTAIKHVLMGS